MRLTLTLMLTALLGCGSAPSVSPPSTSAGAAGAGGKETASSSTGGATMSSSSTGGAGDGGAIETGETGGAVTTCTCDCPDGPPDPPAIDMFCTAHSGVCCQGNDGTGICRHNRCAYCEPPTPSFPPDGACYIPGCCDEDAASLDQVCMMLTGGGLPVATICPSGIPDLGQNSPACALIDLMVTCGWDSKPLTVPLACCEKVSP